MDYYVLFIWQDVEPELFGPFKTEEERDNKARELRASEENNDLYSGIYPIDASEGSDITVDSYSNGFFEE